MKSSVRKSHAVALGVRMWHKSSRRQCVGCLSHSVPVAYHLPSSIRPVRVQRDLWSFSDSDSGGVFKVLRILILYTA
jgi:hypothetical protein